MSDTPRTDAILALLPGGQSCDPQAVADDLRPEISSLEREIEQERQLADRLANALEDIAFGTIIRRKAGGCGQSLVCTPEQLQNYAHRAFTAWKSARNEAVDPP